MEKKVFSSVLFTLIIMVCIAGCASEEERAEKYLENARKYIANNALKEGVLELKNAIKLKPENDTLHFELAETYLKLGEVELAAQSYVNAVNSNPENYKAQLKLGQIFLAGKKTLGARKVAKFILEKNPDNIEAMQLLAAVQVQEKNQTEAIKTLQDASGIDPQNAKPSLFLAQLLSATDDLDAAERTYLKALSVNPSNPDPYVNLIRLYGNKGRWDKVQAVMDRLSKKIEGNYEMLLGLANFFEHHRQWALAEKTYKKSVDKAPAAAISPLLQLGSYYARRRHLEKGLTMMQQALKIDNNNPTIIANIARLHMDMKNFDAAGTAIDKALKIDANHVMANYVKGTISFIKKDYTDALCRFEQTIRAAPDNAEAYYYKALCLAEKGINDRPDENLFRVAAGYQDNVDAWVENQVEKNLNKALELNPNIVEARLILAGIYLRNQDKESARKQIENALALKPDHLNVLSLQGSLKILEKDYKGAEAICKKVLTIHPDNSQWYTRLGIVYATMNRPTEAVAAYKKALEINPLQFDALQLMIGILLSNKRYQEAFNVCDIQLNIVGENRTAIAVIENCKGSIHLTKGEKQAAREHLHKAVEKAPKFIDPRLTLAEISVDEKEYEQAIIEYEGVLAGNAQYLSVCMALGDIHYRKGNKMEAEKYYRRALKIKSDYGPAANNLAFLLSANDNKVREALNYAQLAERKLPNDHTVKDTLGWIHYRMGNYYKAITELERSLAIEPDDALANYHIGLAYYQNNEFNNARRYLKKALELDPDFEGAEEARKMVDK